MDKQLDAISRSPSGGGDLFSGSAGSELRRLSSSVKAHSIILSERVRKVQDCLSALVHDIEKTKERAASKALRRKIWHWFVRIFRALSVLISAGGTIFTLVNPVGFIGSLSIAAASTLAAAVAKLCEVVEKSEFHTSFVFKLIRTSHSDIIYDDRIFRIDVRLHSAAPSRADSRICQSGRTFPNIISSVPSYPST